MAQASRRSSASLRVLRSLTAATFSLTAGAVVADSPHVAAKLGMSFIHQELAFVPGMTVLENIMLGMPKKTRFGVVDWEAIAKDVSPIAARVGVKAALGTNAKGLPAAENWLINITRALVLKARLIVMDEPTAALSAAEAERLFSIIQDLRRSGVAVLYVSHRLDEILELCRHVTVFRDGRSVAELAGRTSHGRRLSRRSSAASSRRRPTDRPRVDREPVLSVRDLVRAPRVKGVSFDLRKGEVLGLGGLVGAGRTELARLLFGADRPEEGSMTLEGKRYAPRGPADAVKAGVGLVPEERRVEGLILSKSLAFNLSLANLQSIIFHPALPFVSGSRRKSLAERAIRDLAIETTSAETPVGRLSGGNQQKVVIARWLASRPKVLILDEPTRGVDVGARAEIHRLIRNLAREGMAVLVISSEPEELPDMCDRALIMAEGRIVGELAGEALTRERIIGASYASSPERNEA